MNFTRKFIEGEGWEVTEHSTGQELPTGATVVSMPPPEPATPVKIITVEDVSVGLAQEVLARHGFVVVPQDVVDGLPKTHQETLTRASVTAPAAIDDAALIEKVKVAATFEELDSLMEGITATAVISAAEQRAMELTEDAE